ncbi:rCG28021 [Rattus norvegicus]|uniref:RCG28021 n=1 Tax=Rattus norvegicus TaxID=10116 RepID=A6IET9_RAT|nr:rCG28021 [Rattus norvegicus]
MGRSQNNTANLLEKTLHGQTKLNLSFLTVLTPSEHSRYNCLNSGLLLWQLLGSWREFFSPLQSVLCKHVE